MQNKFNQTFPQQTNSDDIPEDIIYDNAFENDIDLNNLNQDDFCESIISEQTDDYKFDAFIEKLQEIVIESEFQKIQHDFFEKYYGEFEEKTENKFVYMDIFKNYTITIEGYIEKNLKERVPQYRIEDFYKLLTRKKEEIDDQLYDLLLSFTDFQLFKEIMLDYKQTKGKRAHVLELHVEQKKFDPKTFDNFDELTRQFNLSKGIKK